mmetsp:Transcript_5690/g.10792  ORF Transcript_5690/g.10792 Transcript_5690/m.10792 type:complete len:202 (-) Transcript_5690:116-721(-)
MIIKGLGTILERGEHVPVGLGYVMTTAGLTIDGAAGGAVINAIRSRGRVLGQIVWVVGGNRLTDVGAFSILGRTERFDHGRWGGCNGIAGRLLAIGTVSRGGAAYCVHGGGSSISSAAASPKIVTLAGRRRNEGTGIVVVALAKFGTGNDCARGTRLDLDAGRGLAWACSSCPGGGIELLPKGIAVRVKGQVVELVDVAVE